jgi:hypothetical protein
MKPESRASSEQGLANAVNLAGPLTASSSRHRWLSTPPLAHLVAEASSLCILSVCFDNAGLPTTKPTGKALQAVTKEVVGVHVLLTR